ncbi:MAG: NAD(P)H-hydrate epimerase [Egibacteraceae bacterium]
MDAWSRIRGGLARQPPALTASPSGGRLGAALALVGGAGDGDLELVYTRRRGDLANHPGQISFPGGRAEPGEPVEDAAVREAVEEVGLDPTTVTVIGRLPAFYIPASRFWLQVVVARWERPHRLVPAEAEVAEVLRVRSSTLCDPDVWRVVPVPPSGWSWAWQLDGEHLLWGATAIVTVALLDLIAPGWRRGTQATDLAAQREARPWELDTRPVPRPGPPRLPGIPEVPVDAVVEDPGEMPPRAVSGLSRTPPTVRDHFGNGRNPATVRAAARAVADGVAGLLETSSGGRVLVLVGGGGTGVVALAVAAALGERGRDVCVILDRSLDALGEEAMVWAASLDGTVAAFQGWLPDADVVVDGLVGTGLCGPLTVPARTVVHALRLRVAPVLSIDLPSGLDPDRGLVGDVVSADLTIALGRPSQGLFHPGLWPFVGDLYVADLRDGGLVRLVAKTMCRSAGGRCHGIADEGSPERLTAPNPRTTSGTRLGAPAPARSDRHPQGGWP